MDTLSNDSFSEVEEMHTLILEDSLILQIISKNEVVISCLTEIQIHKMDKNKIKKIGQIKTNEINGKKNDKKYIESEIIKSILIKDNKLLSSTINSNLLIYEKTKNNKYKLSKTISFKDQQILYRLLDLKDSNLICGFASDCLKIIDIETSSTISIFKFTPNYEHNKNRKNEREDFTKITKDTFDPRSKPFLIKNTKYKNYLICFKQLSFFNIIDYKTMKIIKKIEFENTLFQLYKPENKYQFFYVILINKDKSNLEIRKYSSNLSLVQKKEIPFEYSVPFYSEDKYETFNIDEMNQCILKCLVKDENNFSFIYHGEFGQTGQCDMYFLFKYKNGKKNKISIIAETCKDNDDGEGSYIIDFEEIDKNKLVVAVGDDLKGIKEVKSMNIK